MSYCFDYKQIIRDFCLSYCFCSILIALLEMPSSTIHHSYQATQHFILTWTQARVEKEYFSKTLKICLPNAVDTPMVIQVERDNGRTLFLKLYIDLLDGLEIQKKLPTLMIF